MIKFKIKNKIDFNKIQKKILCIIFIFILSNNFHAKTYFVSNDGSNLNDGTFNAPFKSLKSSIEKLASKDTLYIREGIYYLNQTIKIKSNTHLLAYKNENVEIHGTEIKSEWLKISTNLWQSNQINKVLQLFIENKPCFQAAYPNISENMSALINGVYAIAYPTKEMFINGLDKYKNLIGARVTGLHGNKVVSLNGIIKNHNGNKITIENNAFYWNDQYKSAYLDTGFAVVTGSKQFLDSEGEWFWENDNLIIYSTKDPNNETIEIRTNEYIFDLADQKNIYINRIIFKGANLNVSNSSNCIISNCSFLYPTTFFSFPDGFERFQSLLDQNNNVYFDPPEKWTGKGLTISGSNNKVENCYIAHSWGDGLTVWGNNHTIKNNVIYDCDWIANDCAPLTITGSGHLVEYNTISQAARSILVHRKLENSIIRNNHLYDAGLLCEDLGITYCYDTDGKNTEIAYNYMHDNHVKQNGAGLYLDNGNSNFKVHHNIITNSLVGININKTSKNNLIYNNTLYNNTYSMGSWGPDGTELKNVKTFNNLTNTNKKAKWNYDAFYGTEMDSNYIYFEDNIFQDPQNDNFQLRKYSYPIDKGITSEFTVDFNGSLPDLGALESGSIPWEYGSSLTIPNEKYYLPKSPIHLKIVTNTPEITLFSWEYPFGMVDSFYIERKLSTEDYRIIARIAVSNLTFNDAFQASGEYRYQIRAKNAYGISDPSNTLELFNPFSKTSVFLDAENADQQKGTKILGDGLIELDNKDWIVFKQVDFGDTLLDACKIRYAVPCSNAWQNIQVRMDGFMGEILGEYITESTGGWDVFEENVFPIKPTSGVHDVYVKFRGKYGVGTIDWFELYNSNGTVEKTIQKDPKCPQPYTTNSEIPVKLFPNPGNELLRVSFENKELASATVEIYNTIGHKISTQSFTELYPGEIELYVDSKALDLGLKSAFYIIKVNIESEYHNQETILKYIRL
jgi:hypothetical protein